MYSWKSRVYMIPLTVYVSGYSSNVSSVFSLRAKHRSCDRFARIVLNSFCGLFVNVWHFKKTPSKGGIVVDWFFRVFAVRVVDEKGDGRLTWISLFLVDVWGEFIQVYEALRCGAGGFEGFRFPVVRRQNFMNRREPKNIENLLKLYIGLRIVSTKWYPIGILVAIDNVTISCHNIIEKKNLSQPWPWSVRTGWIPNRNSRKIVVSIILHAMCLRPSTYILDPACRINLLISCSKPHDTPRLPLETKIISTQFEQTFFVLHPRNSTKKMSKSINFIISSANCTRQLTNCNLGKFQSSTTYYRLFLLSLVIFDLKHTQNGAQNFGLQQWWIFRNIDTTVRSNFAYDFSKVCHGR